MTDQRDRHRKRDRQREAETETETKREGRCRRERYNGASDNISFYRKRPKGMQIRWMEGGAGLHSVLATAPPQT